MHDPPLDGHDHRLVALVADDGALQNSPRHRFLLTPRTTASGRGRGSRLLANVGLHLGDLAPHRTHAVGVLELAVRPLKAEVEGLAAQLQQLLLELVRRLGAQVLGNLVRHLTILQPAHSPSRVTNRVSTGNFIAARRNASSARSRSEEHTSELQSLMRISYAVLRLKKKNNNMNSISTS